MKAMRQTAGGAPTTDDAPKPAHERSAESRRQILSAAIAEFAEAGVSGARMERIASAAGVNKALLHYHYGDKQGLYQAAIEAVFGGLKERQMAVLARPESAGERALRFLLSHFDYLTANPSHPKMIGQEMMRAKRGSFAPLQKLISLYMAPVSAAMRATLEQGMESGELRRFNARQFVLASIGANIFYIISSPVTRIVFHETSSLQAALQERRAAMLDMAAATIFADRGRGLRLADKILRDAPQPIAEANLDIAPHSPKPTGHSPMRAGARRRN